MTDVRCPICDRVVTPRQGDPLFPFCSRRCKLADLGRWLGGEYRVPVQQPEEDEDGTTPDGGLDS